VGGSVSSTSATSRRVVFDPMSMQAVRIRVATIRG
jgi:hypothetical protein